MARKRVNAARNRIKQLSNEKNSEFILNEQSGSVPPAKCTKDNVTPQNLRKKRSIIRGCTKPFATQTRGKKEKVEPNDPQPGPSRPRVSVVQNICPSRGAVVVPQSDPSRTRIIEAEHIAPLREAVAGSQPGPSRSCIVVAEHISPSCRAAAVPHFDPNRTRVNVVKHISSSRGSLVGPQPDPSRSRIIEAEHISPLRVGSSPATVGSQSDLNRSRIIVAKHISPSCGAAAGPQPGPSRPAVSVVEHLSPSVGGFEDLTDSEMGDDLSSFNEDVESDEPVYDEVARQKMPIDPECLCGLAGEVARLESENSKLRKQYKNLKKRQTKLELSHGRMQQALLSKLLPYTHKPFENVQGFPDCPTADKILRMSTEAKDSDYIFVKLIMNATWPEGYTGKSVTGRTSNNPKGRGRKPLLLATEEESCKVSSERPLRAALDPTKVKFVNDCLIERRLLLHDTDSVARRIGSKCNRLMQSVISNYNRYHSPE